MKPFRARYLAPLAMFTVVASGCGGGDTDHKQTSQEPGITTDVIEFDGVRFDARRDPG